MAVVETARPDAESRVVWPRVDLAVVSALAAGLGLWLWFAGQDDRGGVLAAAVFAIAAPIAATWLIAAINPRVAATQTRTTAVMVAAAIVSVLVAYRSNLIESQILTVVFQRNDPTLYASDLVMQAERAFGSYSFFADILAAVPERIVFVSFYVLWLWCWMAYGLLFARISSEHFRSPAPALAACLVLIGMAQTNYWERWGAVILGDNDLIYPFMRHQTPALVLGITGLYLTWQGRSLVAGLAIGLALNLHVNTGQHCLILIALAWLVVDAKNPRPYMKAIAIALLVGLPTVIPLLQMLGAPGTGIRNPFIVVSGYFRHPNHLLPSTWSAGLYTRYALLLAAGFAAWAFRKNKTKIDYQFLLLLLSPIGFLIIAYIFVEVVPIDFIAKLQFARMTLFSKAVAYLYIANLAVTRLRGIRRAWDSVPRWAPVLAVPVFLVGAFGFARHQVEAPAPNALEEFFLAETPEDSLVLVPLDWKFSHFVARTRRSTVVELKRLPLGSDADLVEYFKRVCAVEGVAPRFTPDHAREMMAARDANFAALGTPELEALRRTYGFDYVVRSAKFPLLDGKSPVFSGSGYRVYDLRDAAD